MPCFLRHILHQRIQERLELALLRGSQKTIQQAVVRLLCRNKSRSALNQSRLGTMGKLAASGRLLSDDPGDFLIGISKHVMEEEDRTLVGGQALQEEKQRLRDRFVLIQPPASGLFDVFWN